MRDRAAIFGGLGLFLVLITFPVWWNLAYGKTSRGPDLRRPVGTNCILPTRQMRISHMDLLMDWREQVVRTGGRTYHAFDGHDYRISLSRTCLGECHTSKAEFCDRCHDYAAMQPYCWDCHVDPRPGTLPNSRGSVTAGLVHAPVTSNNPPTSRPQLSRDREGAVPTAVQRSSR